MSDIFGGSSGKSTSNSSNQAYPMLSNALGGGVANGGAASNQLAQMLGLGGTSDQNDAFKNWQNSTGYQFGLQQGENSVTGNAAAQGLLNSGSTAKALNTYGQNYANTQYQNYLNPLQSLITSGNQSAGVIADTGQQSNSNSAQSSNNGGAGGFIGSLLGK